jgi:RNA polymerase sigma-70 factor (family 1)
MIKELNDQDVLKEIALKNYQEFDKLYRSHYKRLFLISFKYTNHQEVSEEVVHDVFMKIWEQSANLIITQSLGAYLSKAVVNTSLNAIKKIKRSKELAEYYQTDDFYDADANHLTDDAADTERKLILLEESIEKLPPQCKKIILMSKYHKLKQQEIADQLNISIKTVKNHLTYAYKKLREMSGKEMLMIFVFIYIGLLTLNCVI